MSHEQLKVTVQLEARLKEEAAELIEAKHIVDIIEEWIDTVGWLEVAVRDLPICEADLLGEAINKALVRHEAKCISRDLQPISMTYTVVRALLLAVEERKRTIINPSDEGVYPDEEE